MDSKYLITSPSLLNVLNMEHTANDLTLLRYNVAETLVLVEIPPTSPYYGLSFAKTKEEARAIIAGETWQHDPEIFGV